MRAWAAVVGGATVATALIQQAPFSGQQVQLETILTRATRYVGEFVFRFPSVVAEESYLQETVSNRTAQLASNAGRLDSDDDVEKPADAEVGFPAGGAARVGRFPPFRDVNELDGAAVGDRHDRLTRLFLEFEADAVNRRARFRSKALATTLERPKKNGNMLVVQALERRFQWAPPSRRCRPTSTARNRTADRRRVWPATDRRAREDSRRTRED